MLLSLRKDGLTSLFREVRVFKVRRFWKGFWGRVLRRVLRREACCGFYSKKRVLRRVLSRGDFSEGA